MRTILARSIPFCHVVLTRHSQYSLGYPHYEERLTAKLLRQLEASLLFPLPFQRDEIGGRELGGIPSLWIFFVE